LFRPQGLGMWLSEETLSCAFNCAIAMAPVYPIANHSLLP
jgi:hypothetical protein